MMAEPRFQKLMGLVRGEVEADNQEPVSHAGKGGGGMTWADAPACPASSQSQTDE